VAASRHFYCQVLGIPVAINTAPDEEANQTCLCPAAHKRNYPMTNLAPQINLGGSFTLPGTALPVQRMGYCATQLAGPRVWAAPRASDAAVAVRRDAGRLWLVTGVLNILYAV
jgi:hypothetical protein